MTDKLEQLRCFTKVVADTGNFEQLQKFAPLDATTNPSLVLQAIRDARYKPLFEHVVNAVRAVPVDQIADRVVVAFGLEILKRIPGRVSIEVDARLSFDTAASIARAKQILELYKAEGVDTSRVLIKLASTWEGIQAAKALESEGIYTNLTLLFALPQAIACANAKVQLISPFVGRIYDWYKRSAGNSWDEDSNAGANDPGVRFVSQIFACYKSNGIRTEIMGASFRNTGQILALAGCDLLTISPKLLAELQAGTEVVTQALGSSTFSGDVPAYHQISESQFRLDLNRDAMATEKLAEGIRQFEADALTLEHMIQDRLRA